MSHLRARVAKARKTNGLQASRKDAHSFNCPHHGNRIPLKNLGLRAKSRKAQFGGFIDIFPFRSIRVCQSLDSHRLRLLSPSRCRISKAAKPS